MKSGLTDITVILDRSGSMADVADDTIGGFNTFIDSQAKAPGDATLTLRQFDDRHDVVYAGVPVKSAPKLTKQTFQPRGSTALLDAVGKGIDEIGRRLNALPASERPENVIVAIITDGGENASRCFTRTQVFQMITHQRERYNWEFTFIGANQDAIGEAGAIGIPAYAAMNYMSTPTGTTNAFRGISSSVLRKRAGGQAVAMSYTVAEQQASMSEDEDLANLSKVIEASQTNGDEK